VGISAAEVGKPRGLIARRQFREGDVICNLAALFFDDREKLRAFLQAHETFWDRIVRIRNVLNTERVAVTVYAVLIGLGQHLQHYAAYRKSPNARIAFTSSEGFNRGALTLITDTRNAAGIRCDRAIVTNYGLDFAPTEHPLSSPAKKFKGALDLFFAQVETKVADPEEGGEGPPDAPGNLAERKKRRRRRRKRKRRRRNGRRR